MTGSMTAGAKQSYASILADLVRSDPRFVVLTAENRAAIRDLPAPLGDRFIDVGICEQTMIGMAAGFALRGRIPVVHALATFLTLRAFEFIRDDVGIAGFPVKLVGGVPGFLSEANGPTHQAIDDLAVMRAIPGMQNLLSRRRERASGRDAGRPHQPGAHLHPLQRLAEPAAPRAVRDRLGRGFERRPRPGHPHRGAPRSVRQGGLRPVARRGDHHPSRQPPNNRARRRRGDRRNGEPLSPGGGHRGSSTESVGSISSSARSWSGAGSRFLSCRSRWMGVGFDRPCWPMCWTTKASAP